jgi:hypothetical protein
VVHSVQAQRRAVVIAPPRVQLANGPALHLLPGTP